MYSRVGCVDLLWGSYHIVSHEKKGPVRKLNASLCTYVRFKFLTPLPHVHEPSCLYSSQENRSVAVNRYRADFIGAYMQVPIRRL